MRMKKYINFCLALSLSLVGCSKNTNEDIIVEESSKAGGSEEEIENWTPETAFNGLDDDRLSGYLKDVMYSDLVKELPDGYAVDSIQTTYISKEYIEELSYNSKENVFFGYTLKELEEQFQGKRYVFTLDDNGETTVKEVEYYYDDTFNRVLKNVAIGGGVILFCVTVSVATGGLGAPAASMIFAASAKTATAMALSSGAMGAVSSGFMTYVKTGDVDDALKAAALGGSEGFKFGAIFGSLAGGGGEALALHSGTANGLSMNQVALIQKESGYPLDVIAQFHTFEEYSVLKNAGLQTQMVAGNTALVPTGIDLTSVVDDMGRTNLQRMLKGLAPLDEFGNSYELHHIGQSMDGTLAMLTQAQHDDPALHGFKLISEIDRPEFAKIRKQFYKELAKILMG